MTKSLAEELASARDAAFAEAERVLKDLRFARVRERRWSGRTPKGRLVDLELPVAFPDQLPAIYVEAERKRRRTAHVDDVRKVCLASDSGTLIDTSRIHDVLTEALDEADKILNDSDENQTREIEREYLAYWKGDDLGIISICPSSRPTGTARLVEFRKGSASLLACDLSTATDWIKAAGHAPGSSHPVWFVRAPAVMGLPGAGGRLRLRDVLAHFEANLPATDYAATMEWLLQKGLPALLALSSPLAGGGSAIYALRIPQPEVNGFRKGHVPYAVAVNAAKGKLVGPIDVHRADPEYVLPRGGAVMKLQQKTVVLAGCGSVGSHLAAALAATGVGKLILIDHERLATENIHRHYLGAAHVGDSKVDALATVLRSRFPHLRTETFTERIETLLEKDEAALLAADLIVLALGEENLELRMSCLLKRRKRLVHVWLEPFGIGGHVLVAGGDGTKGCFSCLFRQDPEHGLLNESSLVAPNQKFQRSLGGCAGTFTPFGALDAQRAALEAAREVGRVLQQGEPEPRLTSWVQSKAELVAAGFLVSKRGEAIAEGAVSITSDFVRGHCTGCRGGSE